jgi:hypothetical protein
MVLTESRNISDIFYLDALCAMPVYIVADLDKKLYVLYLLGILDV